MTDLDTIFNSNWVTGNVSKPYIGRAEIRTLNIYKRAIIVRLAEKDEDFMGIVKRDKYSPYSHDAWVVNIVSVTQQDAEDIINETRRICAKYDGNDPRFLTWERGNWNTTQPYRWEFDFVVFAQRAGKDIPNT